MRHVAIIAPEFPPSTMPPALRLRFVTPHLSEFGWKPVILTIEPRYYETALDPETNRLLPGGLEVIRTPALPQNLTRKLGVGNLGLRTLWHHWHALSRLCRSRQIDLVFISMPPYFSSILGRLAYERFGLPYVIDYQDPWFTDYYQTVEVGQRPGGRKWAVANRVAHVLESFALRRVAHLTAVSQGTLDGLVAHYPWVAGLGTSEIPLGAEPDDFDYLRQHPRVNRIFDRRDGLLHVSYVGRGGVDMLPALEATFEAVRLGLERFPQLFNRLRMHFVGTTYAHDARDAYQVLPAARGAGVAHLVDEHPTRVPYLDALQILSDSHGLLAVGSELSHYTASKIFPLILARRPLLAVFHEASSVTTILRETRAGDIVTFGPQRPPASCVPEILTCLLTMLERPAGYRPPTEWGAFSRYTGRAMAARLAQAFDAASAAHDTQRTALALTHPPRSSRETDLDVTK